MKGQSGKRFSRCFLSIIFFLSAIPSLALGSDLKKGTYVPGEIVIKLKDPSQAQTELFLQDLRTKKPAKKKHEIDTTPLDELGQKFGRLREEKIFKDRMSLQRLRMRGTRARPAQDLEPARYRKVVFPPDTNLNTVIEAYNKNANIEFAEPNYIRRPAPDDSVPTTIGNPASNQTNEPSGQIQSLPGGTTDPSFNQQWHLQAINAPQAWQFLQDHGINPGGSRDVVIAIIDTGVDYTHPDLAGNMWINGGEVPGNGVDDDGNGYADDIHGVDVITDRGDPMDDHGHGTHVAGIAAAQGNNGIGAVGVAFNVQIMAIKAAQYSGVLTTADIAKAILYAVDKGVDIINMSFGGYSKSQIEEDALSVAFGQAVLVAAAGNDGIPNEAKCGSRGIAMYPAAYPWVLGVMASTQNPNQTGDCLASFSNWDCTPQNSYEYELMAPGAEIYSTLPGGQYASWSGTSMAAPVVSGTAALVRSYFSDKDMYSSRFVMGQIASTNSSDVHSALVTVPEPAVAYIDHWIVDDIEVGQNVIGDGDGKADAGETIELAMMIRNHWGKADDVNVTLTAHVEGAVGNDPYVTWLVDTANFGAVGSFNTDDNGITYDENKLIIAVQNPFRLTISPDTPNDHLIPIEVSITATNGYVSGSAPVDQDKRYFYIQVQRGRELPSIIGGDTQGTPGGDIDTDGVEDGVVTLDDSSLWIIDKPVLIERGVTVNAKQGTEIQWWSNQPDDFYAVFKNAYLQVEGTFNAIGTADDPVIFRPSELFNDRMVVLCEARNYVKLRTSIAPRPPPSALVVVFFCT